MLLLVLETLGVGRAAAGMHPVRLFTVTGSVPDRRALTGSMLTLLLMPAVAQAQPSPVIGVQHTLLGPDQQTSTITALQSQRPTCHTCACSQAPPWWPARRLKQA